MEHYSYNYNLEQSIFTPTHQFHDYIKRKWRWFVAGGIILLILGVVSLGSVFFTSLFSMIALGILLGIVGIVQLVEGIETRKWTGFFMHLLIGLLYLAAAYVVLTNPAISLSTITLIVAGFFFASGLFKMISSAMLRFTQWGWTFFSGMVTFILGILIGNSWPESSLWVIGTYVGIDLLFYGLSIIIFAFSSRALAKKFRRNMENENYVPMERTTHNL